MKAPCCLLGAAALPRPPERANCNARSTRVSAASRASYFWLLCVFWVVLVVVGRASAYTSCPVRTDARDVSSKAYVSPQVVEAVVREVEPGVPGRPYTVTAIVSKKLRGYRGASRVKKRDILTLTFRYPLIDSEGGVIGEHSDSAGAGDCLVSAALEQRHKYLLFLSGANQRGVHPLPVAPPEPATRKLRRLVRKTVCKNCAEAPRVWGLLDDSVVEEYNLTLECSAEGLPPPQLLWLKDGKPLVTGGSVRVRTWSKRLRKRRKSLRRRTRSPVTRPGHREANGRRFPLPRSSRRRHEHGREARIAAGAGGRRKRGRWLLTGWRGSNNTEDSLSQRTRRQGRRHERLRRIGRDERRRLFRTTEDDSLRSSARKRAGAASWSREGSQTSRKSSRRPGRRREQRPSPPARYVMQVESEVHVHAAAAEDAGLYKCVARSVVGRAEMEASIRVLPPLDPHTLVEQCPYDGYCLNGGTCMMFTVVGELVCQCAEGFKGQRCQEKEVYPTYNRNCHGPIKNMNNSKGRRCPRNQPTELWELLQQALALRLQNKVATWTKAELLLLPTVPSRPKTVPWPP